ncbi:MAG: carnitinyl-CoA dehydratase, partial [Actinobacteria bacterium]|nr:carnitinyl-CoA dehydratase [Actinomycetota bacterium]
DGYALMRSGDLTIYASVASSEDAQEGPLAFAERRPPQWLGR